jgi:ATP-dependent helicase Lhr and Lhr-like helicase
LNVVVLPADLGEPWRGWFELLRKAGRATIVEAEGRKFFVATERHDHALALFNDSSTSVEPANALLTALRGWMPCLGPTTVERLADLLSLAVSRVAAGLESLESEGSVLRGTFTEAGHAAAAAGAKHPEWCDRRLLARIHRLTLDGLRRQIQPVEPADYLRFLLAHQRLVPELRLRGRAGLRQTIDQLQGLEIPAGAWESRVIAARIGDYDPLWLDELSLSGEVLWGRLRPPSRDEADGPSSVGLNRVMPIALAARQDVAWLLPPDRSGADVPLRGNALDVLEVLTTRGALFYHDLLGQTSMLPGHLDAALYELAAQGLVSSDAFGAVRALTSDEQQRAARVRLRSRKRRKVGASTMAGRWSLFPGHVAAIEPEERNRRWAWQLLKRWGVVFRDLLERESCAPPWGAVAALYRRMEARGEIRGGRFVAGVGGEQFALPDAVEKLRLVRDQKPSDQWLLLSAADPLNLTGIVLPGPRLPATAGNSLALCDGRIVAVRQAGEVRFVEQITGPRADELLRKWQRTG